METTETTKPRRVSGGTWMETKLGVTLVLSKDDCKALGFSESITSAEVGRQVRKTLGLADRERKAKIAPQKPAKAVRKAKGTTDAHIEIEDIKGEHPVFHVFYAADTKSEQFLTRRGAQRFVNGLKRRVTQ